MRPLGSEEQCRLRRCLLFQVRKLADLTLLFALVFVACFYVSRWRVQQAALVTGTAVDLTTGKPIPGAGIRFRVLNGSLPERFMTDANGRFEAKLSVSPPWDLFTLWIEHGAYAGMLQTTLGTGIILYPADHLRNVTVPGIPGGQISGHVFDESGHSLSGCDVTALVSQHAHAPLSLDPRQGAVTDAHGAYRLKNLSADHYFISADCHKLLPGEHLDRGSTSTDWRRRVSWLSVLYPGTRDLQDATAITVFPGAKISGVDFHLHRVEAFSVRGRFVRAGGEKPVPDAFYEGDFVLTPTDTPFEPFASEYPCSADWHSTEFRCDFVVPGRYHIAMWTDTVWGAPYSRQVGALDLRIDSNPPPELTIPLHDVPELQASSLPQPSWNPTGTLTVQMGCRANRDLSFRQLQIIPSGTEPNPLSRGTEFVPSHYWWYCGIPAHEQKAPGIYNALAYYNDLVRPRGAIVELMLQHATPVMVRANQETRATVPVFTAEEIYQMALQYLKDSQSR